MLKEPEIKLFGRKISLPENGATVAAGEFSSESSNGSGDCDRCSEESRGQGEEVGREEKQEQNDEDPAEGEVYETREENDDQNPSPNTNSPSDSQNPSQNTNSPSESDDNRKTPPTDDDDQPKSENEENGAANSQQKTLKKPDKILPCPRCNSMDTKFCYYNNYNVNQPRHFCKSCQRYWTAGGTMRNVPVGAGRRKNKNSASHCGHITISEALQAARIDSPNGFHNLKFKPNGTVLSFGPDSPCCDPMASALNLAERRAPNAAANGYYKNGEKEKADDCSTGPSPTTSNPPMENGFQQPAMPNMNGFPCIPGVPWPFPWNSAVPLPAIFPPGYPVPYYLWNTGGWNLPWVSPAASEKTAATSPTSPLGKHSRSNEVVNAETAEDREVQRRKSSIVIPKTLRIDDPEEAARSSIWSTLGIKYDSMSSREGLFKAFQPKGGDAKKQAMAAAATTTTSLMQANPAALSRSVTFRETA